MLNLGEWALFSSSAALSEVNSIEFNGMSVVLGGSGLKPQLLLAYMALTEKISLLFGYLSHPTGKPHQILPRHLEILSSA